MSEPPHVRDVRLPALWRSESTWEPVLLELRDRVDGVRPAGNNSCAVLAAVASGSYALDGASSIRSQSGGPVVGGDRLIVSTTTYSSGYTYQITDSTSILAAGMLR